MAQPPLLVDAIQIEPGSGQTLTVSRRASDGSLKFVDAVATAGLVLSQLAGIRNVTGVFVVGRGGYGAPYATIQSAIDAIPDSSNVDAPSLVLVLPGVYEENVVVQKDGVTIHGLGATIVNDGESDTVTVSASIDVTPHDVSLVGLTIVCAEDGRACLRVDGADTFATGTVTATDAPLAVGDTVTVGGVVLTGVIGTRTSGANNFCVAGGSVASIAAEIAAAINDAENDFADLVEATSALGVVTLTAVEAGSSGNDITLAVDTTPDGNLTVSGATLEDGGSADSEVASGAVVVRDCTLVASGVGSLQVDVDTANHVHILGGTFLGSSSTSVVRAVNAASLRLDGVAWANDLAVSYDTAEDRPDDLDSEYVVANVGRLGDVTATLTDAGSLAISGVPAAGDLVLGGDQSVTVRASVVGDLTLSDTVAVVLIGCQRAGAEVDGGTPTLWESLASGSVEIDADDEATVTFDVPGPDADYVVALDSPTSDVTLGVSDRAAESFDIEASANVTGTVGWVVFRRLSGA